MTQFNIQTTKFANLLFNAVALSAGPKASPGFDSILIAVDGAELSVYGQGRYTAGVGRLDLGKDSGEASVCIDRDQADALQSAIRKCGTAQSALLIVEIVEAGRDIEMYDEDGSSHLETVHFVVTFEDEMLCAIPDSDPDAAGGSFWDHIDDLYSELPESPAYKGPVAFGTDSLATLTKLKPPVTRVDLRGTSNPEVVAILHGTDVMLIGTVGRGKGGEDLWPTE